MKRGCVSVMDYNGEHVLHRVIDGHTYVGMATLFNEIQVRNLLPSDAERVRPLRPGERPKGWVWSYIDAFGQMPGEFLKQTIIN